MSTLNIQFFGASGHNVLQASPGLYSLESAATNFTLNNPPAKNINWAPGLYGLSYSYLGGNTSSDLALLASAGSSWVGYAAFSYWAMFENATQGTYTWSALDAVVNACAAQGLQFILQLHLGDFGHVPTPPTGGGGDYLPQYLLTNSSAGAALVGGYPGFTVNGGAPYGYYVGNGTGYWANFTNSYVMGRIQALANAMGARYNGNANFYGVILCAWDAQCPYPGTGITDAQYFGTQSNPAVQGRELILSYFKTAFPNRNICEQTGYEGPSQSVTNPQTHLQWCLQNGFMPSWSDTPPLGAWNANYAPISRFTNSGASFSSIGGGGTTGTLNSTTWYCPSGAYLLEFTSTSQVVTATLTQGAGTCTFSPAVTGSPTLSSVTMAYMPNELNIGNYAWLDMQYPASSWTPVNLMSYGSAFAEVQSGDISNAGGQVWPTIPAATDVLNAANQKMQVSHYLQTILYNSQYSLPSGNAASFANIAAALSAIGVTNTSYPTAPSY